MSAPVSSIDATSKRWLAALALAILASVVILTRSFINALSPPPEKIVAAQPPALNETKAVRTSGQEGWGRPQELQRTSPFPSANSDATVRKKDEAIHKELVHKQAETLRSMIKQDKLPDAYGHLTLEEVDEMEKNGETIQ